MSENGVKCRSVFPETQGDVLKCRVLSTIQRYSVYFHREVKKPENVHISEAGMRICLEKKMALLYNKIILINELENVYYWVIK